MANLERQLIRLELVQRREEGCDVAAFEPRVEKALAGEATDDSVFVELYDELDALEPEPSFPYEEPSDLEAIRALRPEGPRRMDLNLSPMMPFATASSAPGSVGQRGAQLGKPVEGWLQGAHRQVPRIDGSVAPRQLHPLRRRFYFAAPESQYPGQHRVHGPGRRHGLPDPGCSWPTPMRHFPCSWFVDSKRIANDADLLARRQLPCSDQQPPNKWTVCRTNPDARLNPRS